MIFAVTPFGASTGFSVKLFPFFRVLAVGIPVIAVGTAFFTTTVMATDFLPDLAVILVVPAVFATTRPFFVTAATFALEEVKVISSSDVSGFTVRFSVSVCPVYRVSFFTEAVMLVVFTAVLCTLTMILAAFPLASCTVILAVPGVVPAAIVQARRQWRPRRQKHPPALLPPRKISCRWSEAKESLSPCSRNRNTGQGEFF